MFRLLLLAADIVLQLCDPSLGGYYSVLKLLYQNTSANLFLAEHVSHDFEVLILELDNF